MSSLMERERRNDRVVRNPSEKILTLQQLTWINQMYGWIGFQEYVERNNPLHKAALQNIASALPYVQQDAWHEFEEIRDIAGLLPTPPKRDVLYDEGLGRSTLIVATAALANRLDDMTESAVHVLAHTNNQFDGDLFEKTFTKGMSAQSGVGARISYSDLLSSIYIVCSMLEIPTEHDTFTSIIQAQKASIDLVNKWTKEGDMYSVEAAIQSRRNTVGAYYGILARFATPDATVQAKIEAHFNEIQIDDDIADVEDDIYTQVNPFVALLYQEQMLDKYVLEKNQFKSNILIRTLTHVGKNGPYRGAKASKQMADTMEVRWINTFLSSHPPLVQRYNDVFNQLCPTRS